MRMQTQWMSEHEVTLVYESALAILERVGMRLEGSLALGRLAAAGARVDQATGTVRFPEELVRRTVDLCPRRVVMAALEPKDDVVFDEGMPTRFSMSGCVAKTLDHRTGERRPSTLEDLVTGTAVYDQTPEVDIMWTFLTANDVPVERRELIEYHAYLTNTSKPLLMVDCPTRTGEVRRIFETLAGDLDAYRARPRVSVLCAAFSPLAVNGELIDIVTELAGYGAPVWLYSMPIAGATSPVTVAGTLTQVWAEILGMATVIQTAHPGAAIVACCGPGVLDMRTTNISLGCVENSLVGIGGAQVGHALGVPVHNAGLHTDAKHVGIQAGYEKALKCFATASGGADVLSAGFGLMDSSNTWHLPLVPIEAEIVAMVKRMLAETEISQEAVMLEAMERVGIGGAFLGEKETRRRIRAGEHFQPKIGSRVSYDAWVEGGRTEVDEALGIIEQRLAAHAARLASDPYLTDDQLRELVAICGLDAEGRT